MWVLYSKRPLRAEELCHALGVEIGSPDLDPNNVPALRILQSACLGLVTIEASSSIVRLVHFTLQEYLLSNPILFHSPHATIAEVCLTYLNSEFVRDLPPTLPSAPSTMPLLEYASFCWGEHARMETTENVKTLALRLLDRFDEHISAQLLLLRNNKNNGPGVNFMFWGTLLEPRFEGRGPAGFTGVHGGSFLGAVEVVTCVLEMRKWDVNAIDCTGSTALIWAVVKGHEGVIKILLEREDIDPNQTDTKYGRTPLLWAVMKGHLGVVKMFLERGDVNPNQPNTYDRRTPLSWAAEKGHEGIVRSLLEREDISPDQPNTYNGRTPLSWAAKRGHEGVVKMLLEREDVSPDHADSIYGRRLISWAAENGHEEVVKMFLERDEVNPNQSDAEYGRTPLSWAAANGYEGVVKILLERDEVNPNQADTSYGQTPLSWAAEKGYEGVVKILLEREDVNPDQPDTHYGKTPLSWATEKGHEGVVEILLDRQDVRATILENKN